MLKKLRKDIEESKEKIQNLKVNKVSDLQEEVLIMIMKK